ncbi:MAG: hypothetical protein IKG47_07665 [Oscillospiraceae bacterium]|nr:hypothetical protein [Oscillospiraceae bacterium]
MTKKSRKIFSICLTLIYIGINLYLASKHEAWRDEGQSWVLVKNASLKELILDLCVEGHPALWFMTILPFAKLGVPFQCFHLLSITMMSIAFYLMLQVSPFPYWAKLLLTCNSVFWYYNPIIPRIYSEAVLLLVLLCSVYDKREEHPWIYGILLFMLAQSHVLLEGLAIALVFERFCVLLKSKGQAKQSVPSFVLGTIGGLLAFAELFPRAGTRRSVDISSSGILANMTKERISLLTDATTSCLWGFTENWKQIGMLVFLLVGAAILLIISFNEEGLLKTIYRSLTLVVALGIPLFIVFFVYSIHEQMATLFLLILLSLMWIAWADKGREKQKRFMLAIVIVILLASAPTTIKAMAYDINERYSNSKDMANYIIDNTPEDAVILVNDSEYNTPVYSYVLDKREDITFFNVQKREDYKYHVWGESYPPVTEVEAKAIAVNLFYGRSVYWLLPFSLDETNYITLLDVENNQNYTQEYYVYYKVEA